MGSRQVTVAGTKLVPITAQFLDIWKLSQLDFLKILRRWGVPGNLAARAFCSIRQRGQLTTVYGLHAGMIKI